MQRGEDREKETVPVRRREATTKKVLKEPPEEEPPRRAVTKEVPRRWRIY